MTPQSSTANVIAGMSQGDLLFWTAFLGGLITIGTWIFHRIKPIWLKFKYMIDAFNGIPERGPGLPAIPGVMDQISEIRDIAKDAQYHSKPNGGNSAYDHLSRSLDDKVKAIREDVAEVRSDTGTLISTLAEHTTALEDNRVAVANFSERMDASEKDREKIHREINFIRVGSTDSHSE